VQADAGMLGTCREAGAVTIAYHYLHSLCFVLDDRCR